MLKARNLVYLIGTVASGERECLIVLPIGGAQLSLDRKIVTAERKGLMEPNQPSAPRSPWQRFLAVVAAAGIAVAKFGKGLLLSLKLLLPGLKVAKLGLIFGKLFTTGGTMLLSIWFYATMWGWKFAVGFVLSIFVHELGHVYAAYQRGIPVSAPVFIPGMGAMILHRSSSRTIWDDALIALGGPLWGGAAGVVLLIGADQLHSPMLQALAYTTFLINLFNLIPIMPLDGGWIVRAVSPKLWLLGAVGIGAMVVTGHLHNPLVFILLILSVPQMWRVLRHGAPDDASVTPERRMNMGFAYVVLCGTLAWLMGESHLILP